MIKDIDVLAITQHDWSNTLFRYCKCLKYLGLNVRAFKGQPHRFNYPEQIAIHTALITQPKSFFPVIIEAPELREYVEAAKVIWFHAGTFIDTGADLSNKHVIVSYSGGTFRNEPEKCNTLFNPIVDATIMQFPSMLNKGAKNEHLIYYPVDTDYISPQYERWENTKDKLIVGHFPSDPCSKGTEIVLAAIKDLQYTFASKFMYAGVQSMEYGKWHVDWPICLSNMAVTDIIIETIKPIIDGNPFGTWSNAALEAAALGKIVITNSYDLELYKKEYSAEWEFFIVSNREELKNVLEELFEYSDDEIRQKKEATRKWVVENHSIPVTAKRLWEKILKNFFPHKEIKI